MLRMLNGFRFHSFQILLVAARRTERESASLSYDVLFLSRWEEIWISAILCIACDDDESSMLCESAGLAYARGLPYLLENGWKS